MLLTGDEVSRLSSIAERPLGVPKVRITGEPLLRHAEPVVPGNFDREVVETAAQTLHEGVADGEDPCGAMAFQARIGRSRAMTRP